MLLVYYGKGKGKTTAAIGTAIRALGRGWRVLIAQFMKVWETGERNFVKELVKRCDQLKGRVVWINFGTKEFINPNDLGGEVFSMNVAYAYGFLKYVLPELLRDFRPDLVVLDELGVAVHLNVVDESTAISSARRFSGSTKPPHAIITGRYVPRPLREVADLVTKVDEEKHYFRVVGEALEGLDL
ncbi:MAG: cob(I)yrinic acid a,c-diamide adenosyltransferase [Desulfurococcales archaeon]|nr:cob(I)yrinic acid a,c-diamide adenosyltransferase [Desulfurococcales archaeon]